MTPIRRRAVPRPANSKGPEDDLQNSVISIAKNYRVLVAHFRPAQIGGRWMTAVQGDGKGFPDLVLCGTRVLYRELKAEGKYPDPDQRRWLETLAAAGEDVAVWRPRDLHSLRITAELRAIRRPAPHAGGVRA